MKLADPKQKGVVAKLNDFARSNVTLVGALGLLSFAGCKKAEPPSAVVLETTTVTLPSASELITTSQLQAAKEIDTKNAELAARRAVKAAAEEARRTENILKDGRKLDILNGLSRVQFNDGVGSYRTFTDNELNYIYNVAGLLSGRSPVQQESEMKNFLGDFPSVLRSIQVNIAAQLAQYVNPTNQTGGDLVNIAYLDGTKVSVAVGGVAPTSPPPQTITQYQAATAQRQQFPGAGGQGNQGGIPTVTTTEYSCRTYFAGYTWTQSVPLTATTKVEITLDCSMLGVKYNLSARFVSTLTDQNGNKLTQPLPLSGSALSVPIMTYAYGDAARRAQANSICGGFTLANSWLYSQVAAFEGMTFSVAGANGR